MCDMEGWQKDERKDKDNRSADHEVVKISQVKQSSRKERHSKDEEELE
jgi:hypothetical protein